MIYLLSPLKMEGTVHLPMIDFRLKNEVLDFSGIDIVMFTSKQAVKSADALNPMWKELPCLAVGKATAKEIESRGAKVIYHPENFYGEALSAEIIRRFHKSKILYLRPQTVVFDAKAFLAKSGIAIEEKIIYETHCRTFQKKIILDENAIIIFTSPSTIACFFKHYTWEKSYQSVIIGKTTAKHLPKDIRYEIADEATLESSVSKAREIYDRKH